MRHERRHDRVPVLGPDRAARRPVDVRIWLGAIVVCSVAARIIIGRRLQAPWIMVDEVVYSELAKSVATHGHFLVRGVPSTGYGFVYPLLIAPAWRLFGAMPSVYAEAKAINAVLMSLAAVPAYFLARRVLPVRHSLIAAALTVLVPSMLYTGTLMTENAFYPIFLTAALALVAALERPTATRQVLLLATCLLAFETRAQALALVAAAATAPLLLAGVERRSLRPFALLYGVLAAGAAAALLSAAVRGRSPFSLLGAYEAATSSAYTVGGVLHFVLYHAAEIDLYVGVVPFAALVTIWLTPRAGSPSRRAFAVGTLAISFWVVTEVGAFASQSFVDRIEERNTFYLAPFALIAFVGLAVDGVVPTARRTMLAAAAIAVALPAAIPFSRFITTSEVSDTFALLPWWWLQDHWIALGQVRLVAFLCSLGAGVAFVLVPRRHALWLVAPVVAYFLATAVVVDNGRHGMERFSAASYWAGTHAVHPDWIDRRVGRDATVAVLRTGALGALSVWEDEFFNRSVGPVYDLDGRSDGDPLPGTAVTRAPNGWLVDSGGTGVIARYVLAPAGSDLGGKVIARDPRGVDLYRVDGPVVIRSHVAGLYPNDTWSGRAVTYLRVECGGGRLAVTLATDPGLFRNAQTVVARERGRVVGTATVSPAAQSVLRVPLLPDANDECVVRFTVGRTLVPARVERGATDTRALGSHFLQFVVGAAA